MPNSSDSSKSICIPTHTPSSGVPCATRSRTSASKPRSPSADMHARKAPTPGSTSLSAPRSTRSSELTTASAPPA